MPTVFAYWNRSTIIAANEKEEELRRVVAQTSKESLSEPKSSYALLNQRINDCLNTRCSEAQKAKTRSTCTFYRRRKREDERFSVGLSDSEMKRVREEFFVVEVFEEKKTKTVWIDRDFDDDFDYDFDYDEVKSTKHLFVVVKKKRDGAMKESTIYTTNTKNDVYGDDDEYSIEEVVDVSADDYVKDSGARYHEIQFARKFVCKTLEVVDDDDEDDSDLEKERKSRYKLNIGRMEDARAGSRIVSGCVIEVAKLTFRSSTATTIKTKEVNTESELKNILAFIEKCTKSALGLLEDDDDDVDENNTGNNRKVYDEKIKLGKAGAFEAPFKKYGGGGSTTNPSWKFVERSNSNSDGFFAYQQFLMLVVLLNATKPSE